MKRFVAFLLSIVLIFSLIPGVSLYAIELDNETLSLENQKEEDIEATTLSDVGEDEKDGGGVKSSESEVAEEDVSGQLPEFEEGEGIKVPDETVVSDEIEVLDEIVVSDEIEVSDKTEVLDKTAVSNKTEVPETKEKVLRGIRSRFGLLLVS